MIHSKIRANDMLFRSHHISDYSIAIFLYIISADMFVDTIISDIIYNSTAVRISLD